MRMEQLEEDVRHPMRQESTTTREGEDTQDDRPASYALGPTGWRQCQSLAPT